MHFGWLKRGVLPAHLIKTASQTGAEQLAKMAYGFILTKGVLEHV